MAPGNQENENQQSIPPAPPKKFDVSAPSTVPASSLDRLQQRLYAQEAVPSIVPETLHTQSVAETPASNPWEPPTHTPKKKGISKSVLFLGAAIVFFLLSGTASLIFVLMGGSIVSNNNITISLAAQTTIASGTAVPLTVTVLNRNPAEITNTTLTLDFPDGTRSADDVTQPLVRYTDTLGEIKAGASVNNTVQAVLFGSANQTITIPVTIQYRTANSNALFVKQQSFNFTITSAPLTITAQTVSTAASGQPFSIAVAVRSNATTPLTNIAVVGTYPPGFVPVQTGTSTTPLFTIGTLNPGEEKDITIKGSLSGSNNDVRDFGFTVGTQQGDGTPTLAVAYASAQANVTISKPFLAVTLAVNNDDADPTIVNAGQSISAALSWANTLATAITNGQVSVKISGNALDPASVRATNGYYNSSSQTVLFSGNTESSLSQLNPGDTGNGAFSFNTVTNSVLDSLRNPTIQLSVSIAGQPSTGSAESITDTITHIIKVSTNLQLGTTIVHTGGPFTNSGQWPPKVNTPTTYTVQLAVTNTVNPVSGGTVSMILPPYVTYTGVVTPNDGSVTYNSTTRAVTWKIVTIPAGSVGNSALTAAFQISLTPSSTQVGTSPVLIGNQTLTGTDSFTNTQVGNTLEALTTDVTTDQAYHPGFGDVQN
jgi:hypothetical protein